MEENSIVIYLPISIASDENVNIYSSCVICDNNIIMGVLCLEFCNMSWGVRIACSKCINCTSTLLYCKKIVNVFALLEPIIREGVKTNHRGCLVCEKRNCKDDACKQTQSILYVNETEMVIEHFYRIGLDVLSPFIRDEPCVVCSIYVGNKYNCHKCKMRGYCGKGCKKKDTDHVCLICDFRDVWHHNLIERPKKKK